MKKKYKKILVILIFLFILLINFYNVNAFGFEDLTGTKVSNTEAKKVGNTVITFLSTIRFHSISNSFNHYRHKVYDRKY